jgi:cell shape-determining protein MreC
LESLAIESQELQQENKWLLEQLSLDIGRQSMGILTDVVRYEYSPNIGYLYVDFGGDSIKVGDVAVVNRFVVGEVVEVYSTLSKIRLISANQSEIPVKVGSNTAGVLYGYSGLQLVIADVDAGSNVQIGDEVRYLTPLGADVGKFILGKVSKISTIAASPTMELEMETPLDLFNLHKVVLLPNQLN